MTHQHVWEWLEQWPEAVIVLDLTGKCQYLNKAALTLTGLGQSWQPGKSAHAQLCGGTEARHDPAQCPLHLALEAPQQTHTMEIYWPDAEGFYQHLNVRMLPSLQNDHVLLQCFPVAEGDFSIAQSNRLAHFTEETSTPVMEVEPNGIIHYANSAMTDLMADHGFHADGTPAIMPEAFQEQILQASRQSEPLTVQHEYHPVVESEAEKEGEADIDLFGLDEPSQPAVENGPVVAYAWRYVSTRQALSPLVQISGFETTELIRTLKLLEEQKENYWLTVNVARIGVLDWQSGEAVTEVSERCFELLGRTPPRRLEDRFDRFLECLKAEDRKRFVEKWQKVVCGMQSRFEVTVEASGKNGENHWLIIRGKAVEKGQSSSASRVIATINDVSRMHQYQELLQLQRAALDQAVSGIAIFRLSGELEYANASWSRLLGEASTADQINFRDLFQHASAMADKALEAARGGRSMEVQHRLPASDTDLWLTFFPLQANDIQITGLVCFARDITEDRRKEQDLISERVNIEAALQSRNKALSALEVELKDPLGNLGQSLQLLGMVETGPKAKLFLEVAQGAIHQIEGVSRRLFETLKMESANFVNSALLFDLNDMLAKLRQKTELELGTSGVALAWELNHELPTECFADEFKIDQILSTLLSLSASYTHKGEIRVTLGFEEAFGLENAFLLTCNIRDSSKGFTEQELQRLEQPFAIVADGTGRSSIQTALSLAVVRRLVEVLGGNFQLESEVGEGARYQILIPIKVYQSDETADDLESFSAAVDVRHLRAQHAKVGAPFIDILQQVSADLTHLLDDISKAQRSHDRQSRHDALQQLEKRSENFAMVGLNRLVRKLVEAEEKDLEDIADDNGQWPGKLNSCIQRTQMVLRDLIDSLNEESKDRVKSFDAGI